jgi:hypothetical protein
MFIQPDWFEVTQRGVGTNRYGYAFGDPVGNPAPCPPWPRRFTGDQCSPFGSGRFAQLWPYRDFLQKPAHPHGRDVGVAHGQTTGQPLQHPIGAVQGD